MNENSLPQTGTTGDGLTDADLSRQFLTPLEEEVVAHVSRDFEGFHLETALVDVNTQEGGIVSTLRFTLGDQASTDLHRARIANSGEDAEALASKVVRELRQQLPGAVTPRTESASTANQLAHDPVCHMDINIEDALGRSDYIGRAYFFCSAACQQRFEAAPDAVLEAEAGAHATAGAHRA